MAATSWSSRIRSARGRRPRQSQPESPQELGRRILAELPAGFDLLVTKHYVVCFDTSRDYARWCAAVFERLHDAFGNYWTPSRPRGERPDPAAGRGDLRRPAGLRGPRRAALCGAAAGRVAGYYDMLSNRVTTYDLTGSDAGGGPRPAARRHRPGDPGEPRGRRPGLDTRPRGHAPTGLQRRPAPAARPGARSGSARAIATYFETPDLEQCPRLEGDRRGQRSAAGTISRELPAGPARNARPRRRGRSEIPRRPSTPTRRPGR